VGGYSDWLRQRSLPRATYGAPRGVAAPPAVPAAPRRKLSFKEQRELDSLPGDIEKLENEQLALTQKICEPDYHRVGAEQMRTDRERPLARQVDAARMERWECSRHWHRAGRLVGCELSCYEPGAALTAVSRRIGVRGTLIEKGWVLIRQIYARAQPRSRTGKQTRHRDTTEPVEAQPQAVVQRRTGIDGPMMHELPSASRRVSSRRRPTRASAAKHPPLARPAWISSCRPQGSGSHARADGGCCARDVSPRRNVKLRGQINAFSTHAPEIALARVDRVQRPVLESLDVVARRKPC
jgi:transposase-like protein